MIDPNSPFSSAQQGEINTAFILSKISQITTIPKPAVVPEALSLAALAIISPEYRVSCTYMVIVCTNYYKFKFFNFFVRTF